MDKLPQNTKKIPHSVIVRAPGLLPMWYTLRELEEELEISSRTIREWLNRGLSYQRDDQGHIWVNGKELAHWVSTTRQSKSSCKLGDGEAYCLRCRKAVKPLDCQSKQKGKQVLLNGTCPECGCTVNRGGRNGQS